MNLFGLSLFGLSLFRLCGPPSQPWRLVRVGALFVAHLVVHRHTLKQNNEILRLNGIYTGILTRAGVEILQVRSKFKFKFKFKGLYAVTPE